jgi:hypothetical protein
MDQDVDRLDPDKGRDHSAQAVDHQVAAEQPRGLDRLVAHALRASGISAAIIRALKITVDKMRGADWPGA